MRGVPTEKRDQLLLALLLLSAFFLRVYQLGTVHFNIDEAFVSLLATKATLGKGLTLEGLRTSFGFTNPPTLIYLNLPFFAITHNPLLAQLFVVIAGTIAVYLSWLAGNRLGGIPAGYMAATALAFSPNGAEFSRRLWGHDWMIPLAALCLYSTIRSIQGKRWTWAVVAGASVLVAQSIHLSAISLWPAVLIAAWSLRSDCYKIIGTLAIVFLAVYTPWFISQWNQDFESFRALLAVIKGGAAQQELSGTVDPVLAWFLTLGDFWKNDLLGGRYPATLGLMMLCTTVIITAFSLLAICLVPLRLYRDRQTPLSIYWAAIALPVVTSVVLFGILIRASVPYYHLPMLPSLCLILGYTGAQLYTTGHRRWVRLLLVVYILAGSSHTLMMRYYLSHGEASSAPLNEKMAVIDFIREDHDGRMLALLQDGRTGNSGVDLSYAYLMVWGGMTDKTWGSIDEAEVAYVISTREAILRPQVASYLQRRPRESWSMVDVYTLNRGELREWMALTESYPPPTR